MAIRASTSSSDCGASPGCPSWSQNSLNEVCSESRYAAIVLQRDQCRREAQTTKRDVCLQHTGYGASCVKTAQEADDRCVAYNSDQELNQTPAWVHCAVTGYLLSRANSRRSSSGILSPATMARSQSTTTSSTSFGAAGDWETIISCDQHNDGGRGALPQ